MTARNLTPAERDRIFGPLEVTGEFGRDGVTFRENPPLETVALGRHQVKVHALAAPSLRAIASELEGLGLQFRIREALGFQPRRVRDSSSSSSGTNLSAHAYGAAVDVNWTANPQGRRSDDPDQAAIAEVFERHGWFWGQRFENPDPHHFAFQGTDPTVPERDSDVAPTPTPVPMPSQRNPMPALVALSAVAVAWWLVRGRA